MQWRSQNIWMGEGAGGGLPEAIEGLGGSPPEERGSAALGNFCNFSIKKKKNVFKAYFGQKRYFKAITHQLKAFKISLNVLSRINEVQVLYYLYKCNQIWGHICHKRGVNPKPPRSYATGDDCTIQSGAAPRGELGRTVPPTTHKGHFCKSSKTDEKILGVWGVTSPTILEFQSEFVTNSFQRPDLIYILSNC